MDFFLFSKAGVSKGRISIGNVVEPPKKLMRHDVLFTLNLGGKNDECIAWGSIKPVGQSMHEA